jgi:hypothetical protein
MGQVYAHQATFETHPFHTKRTSLPLVKSTALVLIIRTFITVDIYISSLGNLHGWGSHLADDQVGMDALS